MTKKRNADLLTLARQSSVLLLLLAVFLGQRYIMHKYVLDRSQARTLAFQLPVSVHYQEIFNIPPRPDIEAVYLSGSFNDWNPRSVAYRMEAEGNANDTWQFSLQALSGDIQYKYVVYLKGKSDPLWMHDTLNQKTIHDGYGGLNSVLNSTDWINLSKNISIVLVALLVSTFLYFLFHWLSLLLLNSRLKLPQKYFILFSLLLIVSNTIIILYNNQKKQEMTRIAYSEALNLIYTGMKGYPVDLEQLNTAGGKQTVREYFDTYFAGARARVFSQDYVSAHSSIHRLVLFDPGFNIVAVGDRREYPLTSENISRDEYIRRVYQEGVYSNLIAQMRLKAVKSTLYDSYRGGSGRKEFREYARMSSVLGYNLILSPVIEDFKIKAYLGLMIFPQLYAREIKRNMLINISWNLLIIALAILFFYRKIRSPLLNEKQLIRFFGEYEISPREQEITRLMIKGIKYSEIAGSLFISEKTVKAHIYNIYQKAGVENKMGLINCIKEIK